MKTFVWSVQPYVPQGDGQSQPNGRNYGVETKLSRLRQGDWNKGRKAHYTRLWAAGRFLRHRNWSNSPIARSNTIAKMRRISGRARTITTSARTSLRYLGTSSLDRLS